MSMTTIGSGKSFHHLPHGWHESTCSFYPASQSMATCIHSPSTMVVSHRLPKNGKQTRWMAKEASNQITMRAHKQICFYGSLCCNTACQVPTSSVLLLLSLYGETNQMWQVRPFHFEVSRDEIPQAFSLRSCNTARDQKLEAQKAWE